MSPTGLEWRVGRMGDSWKPERGPLDGVLVMTPMSHEAENTQAGSRASCVSLKEHLLHDRHYFSHSSTMNQPDKYLWPHEADSLVGKTEC